MTQPLLARRGVASRYNMEMAARRTFGDQARLGVAAVVAVALATPQVHAAPVASSEAVALGMQQAAEEAYDLGDALARESPLTAAARFSDAGRLFLAAATHRSGAEATTLRWYALKAYARASELDPQGEGGQKAREICARALGPEGEARDDLRFPEKCAALAPKPPAPQPVDRTQTAGAATEGPNAASRPTPPGVVSVRGPQRARDTPGDPTRGLKIGLWTTVALTGALGAVALGTGLARVREPFQGVAYRRIREAAAASLEDTSDSNDIASDQGVDMCLLARYSAEPGTVRNTKVTDACNSFDRLEVASKVTGVAAGVFLGASVALLGLLLKRRRATLDRRRAQLGATRLPGGGVLVTGGFAF